LLHTAVPCNRSRLWRGLQIHHHFRIK